MASTSFRRKVKTNLQQIPGARPSIYNNQLLVSTGIPSLDTILGGGVAVGTVLLIEEDVGSRYSGVMTRYFLAEGVVSQHAVTVVSADEDPQKILQRLPSPVDTADSITSARQPPTLSSSSSQGAGAGEGEDKMSIAWRYQHQPKVRGVSFASTGQLGHHYNLSQGMAEDMLKAADVDCINFTQLQDYEQQHTMRSPHCRFHCVLQRIRQRIEAGKFATAAECEKRNILRIAIQSLGSSLWGDPGTTDDDSEYQGKSLLQFLLALRALLRTSFSVCLLTIPTHMFESPALVSRVQNLCDTVLRLNSFPTSRKNKDPVFRDLSGLVHLVKFPCLNELVSHMPDTLDLAFRCRRKKFTIEKFHLPPELSDSANREQDDSVPIPASMMCAVGPSNPLDF